MARTCFPHVFHSGIPERSQKGASPVLTGAPRQDDLTTPSREQDAVNNEDRAFVGPMLGSVWLLDTAPQARHLKTAVPLSLSQNRNLSGP